MLDTKLKVDFQTTPLTNSFGVEVVGIDLSFPMSGPEFDQIYEAFLAYQVLVFRGQDLDPAAQVAFARQFGSVQVHVMNQYHADGFPDRCRRQTKRQASR